MKKWIIIILVVIVALIVIGVLHENGYLNFKWNTLTIIFSALAGPYMYIKNKLFNKNNSDDIESIMLRAQQGLKNDEAHRNDFDAKENAVEQEIKTLKQQVAALEQKNVALEAEAANVNVAVQEMSSDQMEKEFEKLYGNLKDE